MTADEIHGMELLQRSLLSRFSEPYIHYKTLRDGTRIPIERDLRADQWAKRKLWEIWGVDVDRLLAPPASEEKGGGR